MLKSGIFFAGLLTVAQFSFWGELPAARLSDLPARHGRELRGERRRPMVGTSATLLTTQLANVMPGGTPSTALAYAATSVTVLVYAVGFLASFRLPEPGEQLPE